MLASPTQWITCAVLLELLTNINTPHIKPRNAKGLLLMSHLVCPSPISFLAFSWLAFPALDQHVIFLFIYTAFA